MLDKIKILLKSFILAQKGSALIISILVITIISSIGVSVGRLMVSEIRQTNQIEDSMIAYYAAESGIEQGLLMWRYNHDIELPKNIAGGMSSSETDTVRIKIDDMSVADGSINLPPEGSRDVPYYDLRIWYKNDIVGSSSQEVVCSENADFDECKNVDIPKTLTYNEPALYKDQTVEYNVADLNDIKLKWEFKKACVGAEECEKFKLAFVPIDKNGNIITEGFGKKKIYEYDERNDNINLSVDDTDISRIRVFGEGLREYVITANQADNPGKKMSSRYTIIESTGYFGSAKRRLQIKIDRYSGSILGPYDLLIYQGG